ncbi:Predicted phosphoribosyltransferase [Rhizobiales bacterium GAS113]|nr:Predicted phosphoribosyltransferase [Rhizobiales bacterium GAS113]
MPFHNRADAGRRLARALAHHSRESVVVLALPRGGVPVAAEVASALNAPLDLLLVRKIGYPPQPELAMGAVVDGNTSIIVRNEDVIGAANVSEAEFDRVCRKELAEIERRSRCYLGGRKTVDIEARTVIVIDDGLATGATMRAALRALRQRNPKTIVLAVPVAPTETLEEMRRLADEVVCHEDYLFLGAIGAYYDDFRQVTDEAVVTTLARFATWTSASTKSGPD